MNSRGPMIDSLMKPSALVTGSSRGIGLACAKSLLEYGVEVTGVSRRKVELGQGYSQVKVDLSETNGLPTSFKQFPDDIGVLVLNAGVGQFGGLEQFSYQQIHRLIDVNLISNLFIAKHYLPRLKAQGGGDIVIVGSESGLQGSRAGAVYCATKFALRGVAQSLRADCSTSNVRVMLCNPGPVDSDFFEPLDFAPKEGQEFALNPDDVANAIINALAQPRHVVMEEINLQPMKRSFQKK